MTDSTVSVLFNILFTLRCFFLQLRISFLTTNMLVEKTRGYDKGIVTGFQGQLFEIRWMIWLMIQSRQRGGSFQISTSDKRGEKLDDIVFAYKERDDTNVKLFQLKYVSKKIPKNELLDVNDSDFSLTKYFTTFMKAKNNFPEAASVKAAFLTSTVFLGEVHTADYIENVEDFPMGITNVYGFKPTILKKLCASILQYEKKTRKKTFPPRMTSNIFSSISPLPSKSQPSMSSRRTSLYCWQTRLLWAVILPVWSTKFLKTKSSLGTWRKLGHSLLKTTQ